MIPEKLYCPNCLSPTRLDDNILYILDELSVISRPDWHPMICIYCGGDFVIDDNFQCFIPQHPVQLDTATYNEMAKMQQVARTYAAWRMKKPDAN